MAVLRFLHSVVLFLIFMDRKVASEECITDSSKIHDDCEAEINNNILKLTKKDSGSSYPAVFEKYAAASKRKMEMMKSNTPSLCKKIVEICKNNINNITYDSIIETTMKDVVVNSSDLILPNEEKFWTYLELNFSQTAFLKCGMKLKLNSITQTSHFLITKLNEGNNKLFIFEPTNSNNILCRSNYNNDDQQRNKNNDKDADLTSASASVGANNYKYKLCAEVIIPCTERKLKPKKSLISMKSL